MDLGQVADSPPDRLTDRQLILHSIYVYLSVCASVQVMHRMTFVDQMFLCVHPGVPAASVSWCVSVSGLTVAPCGTSGWWGWPLSMANPLYYCRWLTSVSLILWLSTVPGNIHSGVSGNDSIVATGVYSARELLRVTRSKLASHFVPQSSCLQPFLFLPLPSPLSQTSSISQTWSQHRKQPPSLGR